MVSGCAASSGVAATAIAQPEIAAAYLPLHGRVHLGLDSADGAAVVIAPGIAVTNAHNANLLAPKSVIGVRQDYDLLFFRTPKNAAPQTAAPVVGQGVTAYGQGGEASRASPMVPCAIRPAVLRLFCFCRNAGPAGGPVLMAGRLVGITFGYKDEGHERLIYAYDMGRVRVELSALQKLPN